MRQEIVSALACCNALYRALLSYAMVGAGSGVWWLFVSANVR
jgi:N-glycosylase/DNA lyase